MSKIFLLYYRNMSSMTMEIFEVTDDNIKFNKPWPIDVDANQAGVIDADVNYNPRRQELYNEFICCLTKHYGDQTIENIPDLPLTRILDLAGENMRYPYNNGFYYICEADNPLEAVRKFSMVMNKEETNET